MTTLRGIAALASAPLACVLFLVLGVLAQGCSGVIEDQRGARNGSRAGAADTQIDGGAGSGAGANGSGGSGSLADPTMPSADQPRFVCQAPAERGQGQLAMRRLTRDELLQSLASVVGADVMSAAAVMAAAAQIPSEGPGDIVATFQNGHAFDHAQGLLLTAQAVAAEVVADAAARTRVLGACAAEADRACAEAFLDSTALRIQRRPLSAERRAALLTAFEAAGAGSTGMQWLLARALQAPETVFHIELPRQDCESSSSPADASFAWDDESVLFAPLEGEQTGPQAELTQNGWYVWQIPGARVPASYVELSIELLATSADAVPLELDVNLDDVPLLPGISLEPGAHTLRADVAIDAGASVKVGVQLKNAAAGRSLALRELALAGAQPAVECTSIAASAGLYPGLYPVDDWSVASRLAYALTGEGPDQALLDAARKGELQTEAQVRPHAERLIETPAARRQLEDVLIAWLGLNAIPTPHPAVAERAGIDPEGLPEEAREELLAYATYQILDRAADTSTLMSESIGFPRSERMATLYGSELAAGDEPVTLPDGHGGMLLRIAPMLSGQLGSSPILRGVYVRKRILCDELPSPDFSIVNSRLDELEHQDKTMMTTREAVTEITSQGACPGCHVSINPIGFALETFDPLGMPRTEEIVLNADGEELARHPLDTHVTGANLEPGLPDELFGPEDLNEALADSAKVRACIAERLYSHARLRPVGAVDHCALADVEDALRQGASIRDAWLQAVVGPELFLRESTEEIAP